MICFVSDLHEKLPIIPPNCRAVFITGDMQDNNNDKGINFIAKELPNFVSQYPDIKFFAIPGNHDRFLWDNKSFNGFPDNFHLLVEQGIEWEGLYIYGCPYVIDSKVWGVNGDEYKLKNKYYNIPSKTNILLTHQPPYYHGYESYEGASICKHPGSQELLKHCTSLLNNLIIHAWGHVHTDRGLYFYKNHIGINSAHALNNSPIVVDNISFPNKPSYAGIYNYNRVGFGSRPLELLANHKIGLGKARCESYWRYDTDIYGKIVLNILDDVGRLTFSCYPDNKGNFYGRWSIGEKCNVILTINR
jgi:Icc-related predicted phosphoesterase